MSAVLKDIVSPAAEGAPAGPSGTGTSVLDYHPSLTAHRFHASQSLFRGMMGPIGSGKSVAMCWELFRLACRQTPFKGVKGVRKSRWAIIRASYPELISTTIKTWKDWFPPELCPLKEHDTPITGNMLVPLPDGTTLDMEVVFVAVEREEDTRKLLSMELTGVWFNEARELPWGVVRDAMGRIGRYPSLREGGHTRKAAIADTNPPDSDHWWYKLAEEKRLHEDDVPVEDKDFMFFRQPAALVMTEQGYAPNPAAENIKNLKDGYGYYIDQIPGRDPEWVKVYVLGEYGTIMDGKPVYGRQFTDSIHSSKVPFLPMKNVPLVVTFDFGRTPCVAFMQQTPFGQVRVVQEIINESQDIRAVCVNQVRPLLTTVYAGMFVYATGDPAGTTKGQEESRTCFQIIEEELKGLIVEAVPAFTNDPTTRQDAVRKLLTRLNDGRPGFQLSATCKTLRKGFQGGYKYKTIRMGGGQMRASTIPDKNMYSHIHDALQYGALYLLGSEFLTKHQRSDAQRTQAAAATRAADPVAGI